MTANEEFQLAQITALRVEVKRLNDELRSIKNAAFKTRLTDPNFDKPLNEIQTDFEIVNPK